LRPGGSDSAIRGRRAGKRDLEIDHATETEVEILKGLMISEEVTEQSSNQVRGGMRARAELAVSNRKRIPAERDTLEPKNIET
jgi:hypothetical protein